MNETRIVALVDVVTHPSQRCGWVGLGLELGGDWVLCVCVCVWIIGAVSFGIFYCGGVTFFLLNRVVIVELLVCFVL